MHKPRRTIRASFGLLAGLLFGFLLCAIVGAKGDEVSLIVTISVLWWMACFARA